MAAVGLSKVGDINYLSVKDGRNELTIGVFGGDLIFKPSPGIEYSLDTLKNILVLIDDANNNIKNYNRWPTNPFKNNRVLITGKLDTTRDLITQDIIDMGGLVTTSKVNFDLLLCGDTKGESTDKYGVATSFGIPIMTTVDFYRIRERLLGR